MAQKDSQVVLLPIHPRYVNAILSGDKKVEFRKRCFSRPVKYVVIYATQPIKKVIGYFKISNIVTGNPRDLWRRYKSMGGIDKNTYQSYYNNSNIAVAIGISKLNVLKDPLNLDSITGSVLPPQSYTYLSNDQFKFLKTY